MGQSSDELRQEIDQRRHDAERKIDGLQQQVQGTAQDLRSQAQETATDMRDQMQGTVEDTIETVKDSMNFEEWVQERPLVSLGAALVGGFVLGGILEGSGGGSSSRDYSGDRSYSGSGSSSGIGQSLAGAYKSSGLEDAVNSAAAALMGSLTEQVKQTMDRNMPGFADKMEKAQHTDGSVTEKSRRVQP